MSNFSLHSRDLKSQMSKKHVYHDFGAGGQNQSPHFRWDKVPEDTKSFMITCHDPDAPTPSGWWHWCAFDIPSDIRELPVGVEDYPDGTLLCPNDYGSLGYGGACPPVGHGDHAYTFTIYALSVEKLGVPQGTMPAMAIFMANANILAKATLTSYYGR